MERLNFVHGGLIPSVVGLNIGINCGWVLPWLGHDRPAAPEDRNPPRMRGAFVRWRRKGTSGMALIGCTLHCASS